MALKIIIIIIIYFKIKYKMIVENKAIDTCQELQTRCG